MALRVIMYFGILAVGWHMSSRGKIHEKLMKQISSIQTIILYGLIFIMGVRIGTDEQILASLGQIGIMAAVFALVTASMSILFVYAGRKKIIYDTNITGGKND